MANRRMFSKDVVKSSKFLKMPSVSRNLYYDLGMDCDDDGYCEYYNPMLIPPYKDKDLQTLQDNGFIIIFNSDILGIIHHKENNHIRKNRKKDSKYKELYDMSAKCQPNVSQTVTECPQRLGEVSIGKDRIGKENNVELLIDKILNFWKEESGRNISIKTKDYRSQVKARIDQLKREKGIREEEDIFQAFVYVIRNKKKQADDPDHSRFKTHDWNIRTLTRPSNFIAYLDEVEYVRTLSKKQKAAKADEEWINE